MKIRQQKLKSTTGNKINYVANWQLHKKPNKQTKSSIYLKIKYRVKYVVQNEFLL